MLLIVPALNLEHLSNSRRASAAKNMRVFVEEVRVALGPRAGTITVESADEAEGGRFVYALRHVPAGRKRAYQTTVAMPGWKLSRVRYEHEDNVNLDEVSRLHVGINTWWWPFAVQAAASLLLASK